MSEGADNRALYEITIIYIPLFQLNSLQQISSSRDAHVIFRQSWNQHIHHRESFYVLFLSKSNKVIAVQEISRGGNHCTVLDVKMIVQSIALLNAGAIIVGHNHPSCNLKPSEADKALTKTIRDVMRLIEVDFLDHLILSPQGGYFSFADEGLHYE